MIALTTEKPVIIAGKFRDFPIKVCPEERKQQGDCSGKEGTA